MPLSFTATFTFNGTTVNFRPLLASPSMERDVALSVRHIPGGNVNYADYAGLGAGRWKPQVLLATYADFVILRDQGQGQQGVAIYGEATFNVAILNTVRRLKAIATGNGTTIYQLVELDFYLLPPSTSSPLL